MTIATQSLFIKKKKQNLLEILEEILKALNEDSHKLRIQEVMPAFQKEEFGFVDLLNVLARLGYKAVSSNCSLKGISPDMLPCLYQDRRNKFHVITEENIKTKPLGREKRSVISFAHKNSDDLQEERDAEEQAGVSWLQQILRRFQPIAVRVLIKSLILNLIALIFPFFILFIYDQIAHSTSLVNIETLGAGILLISILEAVIRATRVRDLAWFSSRTDYLSSTEAVSHLLHLPSFAIERASVPSQISRLRSFELARDFFTSGLFLTLLDLPFTFLSLIALFYLAGPIAFVPVIAISFSLFFIYLFKPYLKLTAIKSARKRNVLSSKQAEIVEKMKELRQSGLTEIMLMRFREHSAQCSQASFKISINVQLVETLSYMTNIIGSVVLIYGCVERVIAGNMTSGALFASLILYWRTIAPWLILSGNISRIDQLLKSFSQLEALLKIKPEQKIEAHYTPSKISGPLTFSNVGMRYTKKTDPVCVGLNFKIEKGMRVALIGGNGLGKTTILKLALGLYAPQAGNISISGKDIRQIDPRQLRQAIAYVPQTPEIFDASIAQNVRYGNPLASDEEIWSTLSLADAKDIVSSLPNKLEARLTEKDKKIREILEPRIALARAYLRDADIMLIDEMPYTLLNGKAGNNFFNLFKTWQGQKTVLFVSHREEHILRCDKALGLLGRNRFLFDEPQKVIDKLREDAFLSQRRFG